MKYCHQCGAEVDETHRFCPKCGQNLLGPPAEPPKVRVRDYRRHVKLLAVLLIVWGGLGLLRGVAMMFFAGPLAGFLGHMTGYDFPARFLPHLLMTFGWVFVALSAAAIVAGAGLLSYELWARPVTIAVCILALFRFPLGTALGAYGLWVLLSAEGEQHYRQATTHRG